jgi:ABC-type spermidine/putrescine transport system permease subunit II
MQQHVTIVGWLHIVSNALFLLVGLCGLLFFAGIGIVTGDRTAMEILGIIAIVAALFCAVIALPGILAGYGLLKRQKWGQILGIIVGILSLVNFPIGTAIGLYTLFVLFQEAATSYFAPQEAG